MILKSKQTADATQLDLKDDIDPIVKASDEQSASSGKSSSDEIKVQQTPPRDKIPSDRKKSLGVGENFFDRQKQRKSIRLQQYKNELMTGINMTMGALSLRIGDVWNKDNITDMIRLVKRQNAALANQDNASQFIQTSKLPGELDRKKHIEAKNLYRPITKLSTYHNLKYMDLTSWDINLLLSSLNGDYIITHICLSNKRLHMLSPIVYASFQSMQSLRSIDLSQNCLTDAAMITGLVPIIQSCKQLETLSLAGNRLSISSAKLLIEKVMEMPKFRWIRSVIYPKMFVFAV